MSLIYKTGDLFSAPKEGYFAHAVNAKGKMGSGVAKTFKDKYYNAFLKYEKLCLNTLNQNKRSPLVGTSFVAVDDPTLFKMLCLFTSDGYGPYVDPPEMITAATKKAILIFFETNDEIKKGIPIDIHSPKINSNLFKVPWNQTEAIILECLKLYPNVTWTVWSF